MRRLLLIIVAALLGLGIPVGVASATPHDGPSCQAVGEYSYKDSQVLLIRFDSVPCNPLTVTAALYSYDDGAKPLYDGGALWPQTRAGTHAVVVDSIGTTRIVAPAGCGQRDFYLGDSSGVPQHLYSPGHPAELPFVHSALTGHGVTYSWDLSCSPPPPSTTAGPTPTTSVSSVSSSVSSSSVPSSSACRPTPAVTFSGDLSAGSGSVTVAGTVCEPVVVGIVRWVSACGKAYPQVLADGRYSSLKFTEDGTQPFDIGPLGYDHIGVYYEPLGGLPVIPIQLTAPGVGLNSGLSTPVAEAQGPIKECAASTPPSSSSSLSLPPATSSAATGSSGKTASVGSSATPSTSTTSNSARTAKSSTSSALVSTTSSSTLSSENIAASRELTTSTSTASVLPVGAVAPSGLAFTGGGPITSLLILAGIILLAGILLAVVARNRANGKASHS